MAGVTLVDSELSSNIVARLVGWRAGGLDLTTENSLHGQSLAGSPTDHISGLLVCHGQAGIAIRVQHGKYHNKENVSSPGTHYTVEQTQFDFPPVSFISYLSNIVVVGKPHGPTTI